MHRHYTVLVEYNKDDYKTYKFDELDVAKEVYLHAKKHNLNALILDAYNNVIKIDDLVYNRVN
jgi:hypothetical protein